MNTKSFSLSLASALCAAMPTPASAQSFTNGDFQSGMTGWTVGNLSNGAGAPGMATVIDIDGPGPLPISGAATFAAGQAVHLGGPSGILMTQSLSLVAGVTYVVDFDWSAQKFSSGDTPDGGRFALIALGTTIVQANAETTGPALPRYGHLSGSFTPSVGGPTNVGVRVTRGFTPESGLFQYVDNVTIQVAPTALPVGVTTISGPLPQTEVRWYAFTIPEVSPPAYLDIDTEGSALSPSNNTELGLYNAAGNLVATDDNDGSGALSQLTFGNTTLRPSVGDGQLYNGRDGTLAAGTYYLAVAGFSSTFGATNWNVTSSSINTGNFRVNLVRGNSVVTGACCTPQGGCSITSPTGCSAAAGSYRGDGSTCATSNCPTVLFNAGRACTATVNGSQSLFGFSSGSLPSQGFPNRWSAQAFTLTNASRLSSINVEGSVPSGSEFTTINSIVWRRTGANRPVEGDQVAVGSMPLPDRLPGSSIYRLPVDFTLTAGDYFLTVYASGEVNPGGDANFVWLGNAQRDPAHPGGPNTPIVISDAQGVFMWRSQSMPAPGFQRFTSPTLEIDPNPSFGPNPQNPDYLYNSSFTIIGNVLPNTCYPNCDGSTGSPRLTSNDFQCFLNRFAAGDPYANCDASTGTPTLTANDFQCFLNTFAAGCP